MICGIGFAAHNGGLEEYCGALMHYDGNQWKFASIPTVRFMFDQIRRQNSTGKYFSQAYNMNRQGTSIKCTALMSAPARNIFFDNDVCIHNGFECEVYFSLANQSTHIMKMSFIYL